MRRSGLTLLELVFVILVMTIVGTMTFINAADRREAERWEMTRARLVALRNAIVGDENQIGNDGYRTNFGLHGDLGRLPTALGELAANINNLSTTTAHQVASNVWVGWRGPYLTNLTTQSWDYDKDAWGQALTYDQTKAPPEVASGGSDKTLSGGISGYKTDIVVKFPHEHTSASVFGFVLDGNKELNTQGVRLRAPVNNTLTNFNSTTNSVGLYSFSSVPFGVRSIQVTTTPTISPKSIVIANRWTVVPNSVLNFFGSQETITVDTGSYAGGNGASYVSAEIASQYTTNQTLDKITCWWTQNTGKLQKVSLNADSQTFGGATCVDSGTELDITSTITLTAKTSAQTFRLDFTTGDCSTASNFTAAGVVNCKLTWDNRTDPDSLTITTP